MTEEKYKGQASLKRKCLRGNHDGAKRALHLVSAFASEARIVLGQRPVADKSNEITAIPELLDCLDVRGSTVTIDAMGCQTNIAEQIIQGGGDTPSLGYREPASLGSGYEFW